MTKEENDRLREWQHAYADEFFDLFVQYELDNMHERIMPEGEIYSIAYDNSLISSENFQTKNPREEAAKTFKEICK